MVEETGVFLCRHHSIIVLNDELGPLVTAVQRHSLYPIDLIIIKSTENVKTTRRNVRVYFFIILMQSATKLKGLKFKSIISCNKEQ
jgi:hypothetical protein